MANPNYRYPPAPRHPQPPMAHGSIYANAQPQRSRFAFAGPPSYPRPRSSATKPNPENQEALRGRFGSSEGYMEKSNFSMSSNYGNNSFEDEYSTPESYSTTPLKSSFGSISENFTSTPIGSSYGRSLGNSMYADSMMNNYGNSNNRVDSSFTGINNDPYPNSNDSFNSPNNSLYYSCNESFSESPKKTLLPLNPAFVSSISSQQHSFNPIDRHDFPRYSQNKKDKFKQRTNERKFPKQSMKMKTEWQCSVCSMRFTSNIPYEMHLRGAKHAKKLKLQDALQSIKVQVDQTKEIDPVGNVFRCDMCNITANSSVQLQTHLDGTKHKTKLQQQQNPKEENKTEPKAESEVNGKSNGAAVIRALPAEFGEPQRVKMCKFSCVTCGLVLNSDTQLQQHLGSKKHQAKVEGKPAHRKKLKPKQTDEENDNKPGDIKSVSNKAPENTEECEKTAKDKESENKTESSETTNVAETRKTFVGVKTLSSSFVFGDTLQ
ncbi:hypothetical protein CEXT_394521 [Caerostris extrusa]|uniref:C2H2-type domain-containing protein n=1 Tax=Caerostris extrusa TaxID=172846 RepID=A0AAV4TE67_CAEEX|nr:hypothetical protein CEXT_394521 [Caerostris extrusa]